MAVPYGSPRLQVTLRAAIHWRVVDHQRRRLPGSEPYGVILPRISGQGVYVLPARPVRGAGDHVVARDQRRQPTGCPACLSRSSPSLLSDPLATVGEFWT